MVQEETHEGNRTLEKDFRMMEDSKGEEGGGAVGEDFEIMIEEGSDKIMGGEEGIGVH